MVTTKHLLKTGLAFCLAILMGSMQTAYAGGGATEVVVTITPGSFPLEIVWELVDDVTAGVVASRTCGTAGGSTQNIFLNDGQTYTFNAFDDWGDGWNGGTFEIKKASDGCVLAAGSPNNLLAGDNTDNCIGFSLEASATFQTDAAIVGCTDPAGSNFNPCATVDDGSCILPATNDACSDAIDIPSGTCYTGSNTGATAGDSPLNAACIDGILTPVDIWFTTTVGASGSVNVIFSATPGASSIVELYLGTCDSLGSGILAGIGFCNNYGSGGGFTLTGLPSAAVLTIRYWDFNSNDFGGLTLCIDEPIAGCTDPCASNFDPAASIDDGSCVLPTLDADDCSAAATISAGITSYYSVGATGSDISSCTDSDSLDILFAYDVPAGLDSVLIYTCGSTFDTGLSLWDACGGAEIACNDDGTPAGGSICGGSNFQSYILLTDSTLASLAGSTIYIRIAGFAGNSGCGDLNIEERGTPPPAECLDPTNLASIVTPTFVLLSWDVVPGAIGYRVQGSTGGGPKANRNSFTNSKIIPGGLLLPGTCYDWRVKARCEDLLFSGFSAPAEFCTPEASARLGEEAPIQLYPNPANEQTILTYTAQAQEMLSVQVFDMSGKLMMTESANVLEGSNNITLNTADLISGSYLVQIMGETKNFALMMDVKH